jgi:uncharacterized membrane protein YeiB
MAEANIRVRAPGGTAARIVDLDALRGFALCGIIFVNIYQVMLMEPSRTPGAAPVPAVLLNFFQARFYPIFSVLFGISFGLFLRAAEGRSEEGPRLLLIRRLLVLGLLGAFHAFLHPGEVLLPYAVVGLVLLLPLSFAPGWISLVVGTVFTVAAVVLFAGGISLIPGLFALGFGVAAYALPDILERLTGYLAAAFLVFAALCLLTVLWRTQPMPPDAAQRAAAATALLMSMAYLTGFLLLLRTPLRPSLVAVLAPMGRMALTNYVTATLLFVPIGHAIGLYRSSDWDAEITLAITILVVQAIWSVLWLRGFRYGPLEWIWRCLTWWQSMPMRKPGTT